MQPESVPKCSGIGAQVLRNQCPDASGISAQVPPEPVPKRVRNTHEYGRVPSGRASYVTLSSSGWSKFGVPAQASRLCETTLERRGASEVYANRGSSAEARSPRNDSFFGPMNQTLSYVSSPNLQGEEMTSPGISSIYRMQSKRSCCYSLVASAMFVATSGCAKIDAADGEDYHSQHEETAQGDSVALEKSATQDELDEPIKSADLKLLAEVVTHNRTVKFYEAAPGHTVVTQTGPIDRYQPITQEERSLSAVALYERLSGNVAPQALEDAANRQAERMGRPLEPAEPDRPPTPFVPSTSTTARSSIDDGGDIGSISQALAPTYSNFRPDYCWLQSQNWADEHVLWTNVTGQGSYERYDKFGGMSAVQVVSGSSVTHRWKYRFWYTWSPAHDTNIPIGYYHVTFYSSGPGTPNPGDFDIRFSTLPNTANYDWCMHWQD
jgi:hypothetical protein